MPVPQIVKEQGGSVMRFKDQATLRIESGGSLILDSGASLLNFGNAQVESGTCMNVNDGASLTIKPTATTENVAYKILQVGKNWMWYSAGSGGSPVFSASPGDLLWLSNSASTGIWLNVSDGTAGSKWYNVSSPGGSNVGAGV